MHKLMKYCLLGGLAGLGLTACTATPAETATTAAVSTQSRQGKSERIEIQGAAGKLAAVLHTPATQGQKVPLVILMHGVMSKKEAPVIEQTAKKLEQAGFATLRFDFNGHGQSEGRFEDMTVPKELADAEAVYAYARALPFAGDISLVGHSQGGVVASLLAGKLGKDKIKHLALFAPAAVLEDEAKAGTTLGSRFDPKNPPEYLEVFGHRFGRDYLKTAQSLNIYQNAGRYQGKVTLIHGTADDIVPYPYSQKYDRTYADSRLFLVKGENHAFEKKLDESTDIAVKALLENR